MRDTQSAKSCGEAFIIILHFRRDAVHSADVASPARFTFRGIINTLNLTNPPGSQPLSSKTNFPSHSDGSRARDWCHFHIIKIISRLFFFSCFLSPLNTCVVDNNADGLLVNDEISFLSSRPFLLRHQHTPHESAWKRLSIGETKFYI